MSTAPRVWITRTQPGADATAERVRHMGWEPVVAPLLEVRALEWAMRSAPPPSDVACVALTSPNTLLTAREALAPYFDTPTFAVGDTTADAATAAGFTNVRSAKGDIHALAGLIARHIPTGTVFAPGALEPAGDLPALLPALNVVRLPVYETIETDAEMPANLAAVLAHSPRAARILAKRLNDCETSFLKIITISNAASAPLNGISGLKILTSSTPDEEGVLRALGNAPTPV